MLAILLLDAFRLAVPNHLDVRLGGSRVGLRGLEESRFQLAHGDAELFEFNAKILQSASDVLALCAYRIVSAYAAIAYLLQL